MLTRELTIYSFIDKVYKQENNFVWCKSITEQALSGLEVFEVNHKSRAEGEFQRGVWYFLFHLITYLSMYVWLSIRRLLNKGNHRVKISLYFS